MLYLAVVHMSGLIDHIREGRIRKDETVVFVHTGGNPALFAYNQELMSASADRAVTQLIGERV